ncbi:hypothetical protein PICMEDRAFT_50592 [Pichia membranifaciens NRRL Y-2026]|uniref:Kinesin-like protein n=1 Tax=Pichia membranifaciens NRRL Y-2026 TaxID=763406 RepID=A0A1E3NPR6_9ASCO|nr:hypothetical protein PICMEDRAFT_50592 [Pichia membranifaciens NRRL Y-2026]ODQ47708.1 hypothetical protein PICMEDRAFT_50592 [Pichia membranifaciens NRRL Y-2026]
MQTPTRNTSHYRNASGNNVAALRPSSTHNQRSVSERLTLQKDAHKPPVPNNNNAYPYTTSNSTLNPLPRAGSRTASRAASRVLSRGNSAFPTPSGLNSISSCTPQRRTSLSRSTSRSSSSIGTSSVSSSRIPSNTIYSDSPLSLSTLENNSQRKSSRIRVTVRPCPLTAEQNGRNMPTPWNIDCASSQIEHPDLGFFQYDHVFATQDDNQCVFDVVGSPVIQQCLDGYNGTIFAYGMTGSGKTYSMRGVVRNSVSLLFDNCTKKKINYMTCSILEIYNEKLNDLLAEDNKNTRFPNLSSDLRIVDDDKFGISVRGLREVRVTSTDQLLALIDQGELLRCTDSTDYNYRSSRSHFIIMLKLFMEDNEGTEIVSSLNFCDLAGSERATSHTDRRKEGGYINKSLLALGTVITKLSENVGSSANVHVPYRDSKLTRILQPSLSGGSMVSILCTIQLGLNVIGETTNTLRFGFRARNVVLNVKQNTADNDLGKLMQENENLKLEIAELRSLLQISNNNSAGGIASMNNKTSMCVENDDLYYELVAENNILNEQVEHLKRLQLEDNIRRSQHCNEELGKLNDLLDGLDLDPGTRKKSKEIFGIMEIELREYNSRFNETESYVAHLENRIRVSEIELARYRQLQQQEQLDSSSTVLNTVATLNISALKRADHAKDELLEELQEEIAELKQTMRRKDAMIRALQKVGVADGP